jgi:hypothetical protein
VLKRFRTYSKNVVLARKWQEVERGSAEYGETQFMDLTVGEFREVISLNIIKFIKYFF